ncbi:ATP-binding protein [Pedobacter miscanthi]|jgi:PAS domain S-box-containing protein|uniref:hybrid sensor histidine kinase/response regulator n=1 Tax=Pedobacter miscanthi TaxID=2259170 RepID=UPI00292E8C31|nr:ATP-binding protein [Pedobacter miscanthi]
MFSALHLPAEDGKTTCKLSRAPALQKPDMIVNPKVLILEDNEHDADLLCRELKKSGLNFVSKIAQNRPEYEYALENFRPDIILSDYSLPSFDAVSAFHIKQSLYPLIPFIIVSGIIGEENAVALINSGVTDYASKDKLFTVPAKINRALKDTEIRREKLIADETLKIQAAELMIANHGLLIQNREKEQHAQELRLANELLTEQKEKVKSINQELSQLNAELENRVTKRTKALAESENRFRNMMETIPQIAWTNTVKGKVDYYNQRWYDYTGLSQDQTQIGDLVSVVHPDDLKEIQYRFSFLRKRIDGGEFQVRAKRADGLFRWHLIRLMPIKNVDGMLQQWVGTATDIHELRILQQHKDDFISIASHELKTPITSLKGSLQLLDRMKDNPSPAVLPKLITQANKSLEKVYLLIEDLLNTSKANEDQLQIKTEKFNLLKVISECCDNLPAHNPFNINVKGDETLEVDADISRTEQVVINFVNNAMKYAPDSKNVEVLVEKLGRMAKVSVIDKGAGIPQQNLRFLFDRYYRINHGGSEYTGLGLGLYICAEIIKKHHGTIGADSEVGLGSTFWFTLPVSSP